MLSNWFLHFIPNLNLNKVNFLLFGILISLKRVVHTKYVFIIQNKTATGDTHSQRRHTLTQVTHTHTALLLLLLFVHRHCVLIFNVEKWRIYIVKMTLPMYIGTYNRIFSVKICKRHFMMKWTSMKRYNMHWMKWCLQKQFSLTQIILMSTSHVEKI